MHQFKLPDWSSRNPLGIIAIMITLVYGMAALLLGRSAESLSIYSETILTSFVALFPIIILTVFAWLVSKHHRKLYGPSDFRSDESFLSAVQQTAPSALGERLRTEVIHATTMQGGTYVTQGEAEQIGIGARSGSETTDTPSDKESPLPSDLIVSPSSSPHVAKDAVLTEAYVAENLVFQELQYEFSTPVFRNIALPFGHTRIQVDGMIETSNNIFLVELMFLKSIIVPVAKVASDIRRLIAALEFFEKSFPLTKGIKDASALMCFVFDVKESDQIKAHEGVSKAIARVSPSKVESRIYFLDALLHKYGLPEANKME